MKLWLFAALFVAAVSLFESTAFAGLGSDQTSIVVDSLMQLKYVVVTVNRNRADAILKGTALKKTSQEQHAISESGNVATASTYGLAESDGCVSGCVPLWIDGSLYGTATVAGWSASTTASRRQRPTTTRGSRYALSTSTATYSGPRLKRAVAPKYNGATADAADRLEKQLLRNINRIED